MKSADSIAGLIWTAWSATLSACLVFLLFIGLSYRWIFRPLRTLIAGSRRVAAGEFSYRIRLDTGDEMAELAKALNDMTIRFQEIRDDLDRQVRERTLQAVRSEQLASVGFLAAGVAHEINNPLASIAMCAESLEGRFRETLDVADPSQTVIADYLRMIQTEAFRCKGITEKLLDFSRIGPGKRENTELGELVQGVLEMLRPHGEIPAKTDRVCAVRCRSSRSVNPQEIKQVVLNLLTNASDSLDEDGARCDIRAGRGWRRRGFFRSATTVAVWSRPCWSTFSSRSSPAAAAARASAWACRSRIASLSTTAERSKPRATAPAAARRSASVFRWPHHRRRSHHRRQAA